jgi:PAS domain S-box-containing protein
VREEGGLAHGEAIFPFNSSDIDYHAGEDAILADFGVRLSDLAEVLDAAVEIGDADFGNIQLIDPGTGDLRIVAQRGFPQWWVDHWNLVGRGKGACGAASARGERVIVEDVEKSPIFVGAPELEIQRKAGVRALQSTPLITRSGRPLGMFSTHYRKPYRPDERTARQLDLLARQASDLIARAKAETALRESEERYRSLVEQAVDGIILADPTGRLLEANAAGLKMLGYTLEELRKLTIFDVRIPEEISRVRAQLANLDTGEVIADQWRFRRKDGSTFDAERVGRRLPDGRLLGIVRDVTARRQSEAALRESEERFRAYFDNGGVGMAQLDHNGRFLRVNDRCCQITGYSRAELENGMSPLDLRFPEDRERDAQTLRRFLEGDDAPAETVERRLRRKDGQCVWVRVTRARIHSSAAMRSASIIEDITERKRAEMTAQEDEARLAALFEGMPVGVALVDTRGVVVMANPEMRRFIPTDTIPSRDPARVTRWRGRHPDGRPVAPEDFPGARALRGDRVVPGIEMLYTDDEGHEVWTHVACVPVREDGGRIVGAAVVLSDVSQIKRAEGELADLNARLSERLIELERETRLREQAQAALNQGQRMEALGQLAGGVAHDFNNLLTVISGNMELAEPKIADVAAKRAVRRALDAIELGAGLNRRLLSFARRRMAAPERVILNDRVLEMTHLLRRTLGDQIRLETRLDAAIWPTRAELGEIDSAIVNIAVNARDAMPNGGRLAISTANVTLDSTGAREHNAQAGDYAALIVSDAGCGMSEEVLRKSIEPFFTTKGAGKGTGLGLSSVYGFARRSGGFVDISSEVGRGTTVRVYLPRMAEALAADAFANAERDVPLGDGELVLVVEDNDQVREVTLKRLEALGYAAVEALDGAQAIGLLKNDSQIRLVLSDVAMPGGISGYDVAEWVRIQRPAVKVLLASGHNEVGGDGPGNDRLRILSKPYSRALLAHALRELLDG